MSASRFIEFEWLGSAPFDASKVSILGDTSADGTLLYPHTLVGNRLVIDTGPPSKDRYDVHQLTIQVELPDPPAATKCTARGGCKVGYSFGVNGTGLKPVYQLVVWGRGKP